MDFFNREETHYQTTFIKLEKLNKAAVLIPSEYLQKRKITIKQFAQDCYEMVHAIENNPVYVGVSKLCTDVGQYYKKWKEAQKAIEIAKVKNRLMMTDVNTGVVHAEELGHIMILLDARRPEELLEYAHEFLYNLKSYDEKNSSELVRTLFYYIENECNLHKTAREMNVSISGMRYRIQRIEELIGLIYQKPLQNLRFNFLYKLIWPLTFCKK